MLFRKGSVKQWLLGFLLHLVLFLIIGKMEDKSSVLPKTFLPKSEGGVGGQGPAKRLILIVLEGLRWDFFYTMRNVSRFPGVITYSGTIGPVMIDNPSERYSGLLTIVSGVPEGECYGTDNVFQHARTLYIGPPSVRGVFTDLKESYCYPEKWENQTAYPNETRLDKWVFEQWYHLMSNPIPNILDFKLFLFYLSGLNMASRLDGTLSYRAINEMRNIFDGLESLYERTEKFFKDEKTSYIITSDIGQTEAVKEWPNPSNYSLVPFMVWGAGFAIGNHITTNDIALFDRKDWIKQQDLTPIISYLLSTSIPANSFGNAPIIRMSTNKHRAELSLLNTRQLINLYLGFEEAFGFGLTGLTANLHKTYIDRTLSKIEQLLLKEDYTPVILKCQELIDSALEGISYYRSYESNTLWGCALVSLIAWIVITFGWVMEKVKLTPIIQREMVAERQQESEEPARQSTIFQRFQTPCCLVNSIIFILFCILIGALLFISAPPFVCLAAAMAMSMVWVMAKNVVDWIRLYRSMPLQDMRVNKWKPIIHLAYFLLFTCILSVPIIAHLMFSFAIIFSSLSDLRNSFGPHLAYWMLSSLSYLVLLHYRFETPYLPVLILAAVVWLVVGGVILNYIEKCCTDWPLFLVAYMSIGIISIHSQYGPPLTKHDLIIRSTPAALIFFVPLIGSSSLPVRLFQLCVCLSVPVFLMSLNFEPISFLVALNHLFSWALLEGYSDASEFLTSSLHIAENFTWIIWSDVRRVLYFLAYVLTSFLIIGNSCEVYKWPTGWVSYFQCTSDVKVYYCLVCLKSLPVVLVVSIVFAIFEKKSSVGYLPLILHLSALVSLFNLLFIPNSPTAMYNQLMFLFILALRPIAYLLLNPSVFSLLIRPISRDECAERRKRSPQNKETVIVETSL